MHLKLQVSHYLEVGQFTNLVKQKLKDFVNANSFASFAEGTPARLWLMPE
jgi:hypothetical protein